MRVKSYFAGTVEEALRVARQEMGDDALLLNSRKAPPEARHLGHYEVVFGLPAEPLSDANLAPPTAAAAQADSPVPSQLPPANERCSSVSVDRDRQNAPVNAPAPADLAAEVAGIRRELERMAEAVSRSSSLAAARNLSNPHLAEALSGLIAADVDAGLAFSIVQDVESRLNENPLAGVSCLVAEIRRAEGSRPPAAAARHTRQALAAELSRRIQVSPGLPPAEPDGGPAVIALIGPPGAGKTTTLVKLAAAYGVTARRPTQLLTTDTWRIAAAEQLRCYAAILGAGFQACETTGALAQALEENRHKGLILIDTPGFGPRDSTLSQDLARFLSSRPDIDTHLVLSCSAKSADLSAVVERFLDFRPARLLFTKLDETATYGAILNEACRTGLPVSFLTFGQEIPDDFEAATQTRIADLLLKGRRAPAGETDLVVTAASAG